MPTYPLRWLPRLLAVFVSSAALATTVHLSAQPSGGPYGPQPQTYAIPAEAKHVYYVAPDGSVDAPGTDLAAPTTIESALARVVTGDAIILRGGTYRTGNLVLNQGITIQPYADEQPVFKGTRIATEWTQLRNGLWRTSWPTLFPSAPRDWWRREREGARTPLHRFNNDMLFLDGVALRSAGWEGELDDISYYIDYAAGHVYLRADPTNRLVEITAFDIGLLRTSKPAHGKPNDRRGYTMRGVTFTQYAYRALEVDGHRGTHRRSHRRRRSRHLRQRSRRHRARTLHDHPLLARRRLFSRRRPRHPPLPRERHLHRRHLCHRFLRLPPREKPHRPQQRRTTHRLLPVRR
jgi:hypothetical protein